MLVIQKRHRCPIAVAERSFDGHMWPRSNPLPIYVANCTRRNCAASRGLPRTSRVRPDPRPSDQLPRDPVRGFAFIAVRHHVLRPFDQICVWTPLRVRPGFTGHSIANVPVWQEPKPAPGPGGRQPARRSGRSAARRGSEQCAWSSLPDDLQHAAVARVRDVDVAGLRVNGHAVRLAQLGLERVATDRRRALLARSRDQPRSVSSLGL